MKLLSKVKKKIGIPVGILNYLYRPNKDAIWVFGLQKAGTSAIAGLLAHMNDYSVTLDTTYLWAPYSTQIKKGEVSIENHAKRYSYPFSKDIIKEPGATFYIDKIESFFNLDQYVFITRNPYSNIRSILNRLDLRGDQDHIDIKNVHPNWRSKFPGKGNHYIRDLANLWIEANDQDYYMFDKRSVLVKYEDFKKDKENFIKNMSNRLNLPIKRSIADVMDKPFQPRGNSNVDLKSFFGPQNIKVIYNICGERMEILGYNYKEILE